MYTYTRSIQLILYYINYNIIYVCVHTHTHTHTHTHVCIYIYTHIHTHTYIYIYIYTHTHTHSVYSFYIKSSVLHVSFSRVLPLCRYHYIPCVHTIFLLYDTKSKLVTRMILDPTFCKLLKSSAKWDLNVFQPCVSHLIKCFFNTLSLSSVQGQDDAWL